MNRIEDEEMLVVRYLKSKSQVAVPDDVYSMDEFNGFEPALDTMAPDYETDSPDGPGYETSVFVYRPSEGINWNDGINLFSRGGNPNVPAFAVQMTVKDVHDAGLYVASQPYDDGTPHASIRGFSDDGEIREDQSDQLAVSGHCVIRPDQEEAQLKRAAQIVAQNCANLKKQKVENERWC